MITTDRSYRLRLFLIVATILLLITSVLLSAPQFVLAQETPEGTAEVLEETEEAAAEDTEDSNSIEEQIIETIPLQAEAGKDKVAVVNRNVQFDSSGSTGVDDDTQYTWDFGDGQEFNGVDASHIYASPGTYKVKLTITNDGVQSKDTVLVTVAREVVLLIVDETVPREEIQALKATAQRSNVFVSVFRPKEDGEANYAKSQNIAQQLITSEDLNQAEVIITWTEKNIGLEALSEVGRIFESTEEDLTNSDISFSQKAIVRVDDKLAGSAISRLAQNTYNILGPNYVLLTTTDALNELVINPSPQTLISTLQNNSIEYQLLGSHSERVLGSVTPFNFFSYGINILINEGVSPDTVFLLLIFPVVATIISFGRQIVGVKAFGIYVPSMITLTFVVTELRYGLLVFLVLLAVATISRLGAKYLRILYMPRMAIVLTIVSLSIFIMFLVASALGANAILGISIFPILVMIILTEKFIEAQIEKGSKGAIILTTETLALAILSYAIVTWDTFANFISAYPEAVLLTFVLNMAFGRFSGLRLFEYIRFRKLFKQPPVQS